MLLHQPPRLGKGGAVVEEAGAVEVDVGEVERHRTALGDLLGLVEVGAGTGGVALSGAEPGTSEETQREVLKLPGATEAIDGLLDLGCGGVGWGAGEENPIQPS